MESQQRKVAMYAAGVVVIAIVGLAMLRLEIEPFWIVISLIAAPVALWIARKQPVVLIPALMYVGRFKGEAATGIQVTDPTFLILFLTVIALAVDVLFLSSASEQFTLRRLLHGQSLAVILYFGFVAVMAISYFYTPARFNGGTKLLRFSTIETLAFFGPLLLLKTEKDLRRCMIIFVGAGFVLNAKTIVDAVTGASEAASGDVTRIGNAQLIGITILVLLYYPLSARYRKVLLYAGLPFLAAGMMFTVARGPIVSLAFVLMVAFFLFSPNAAMISRKQIAIGVVALVLIAAVAAVWVSSDPATSSRFQTKQRELVRLLQGEETGGTAGKRLGYYRAALELFQKKPLAGWGVGSWGVLYFGYETDKVVYPHNIVLETAVEEGLMGLLILLGIVAYLYSAGRLIIRNREDLAFVIPIAIYCFLFSMFSGDIGNRAVWAWLGIACAVARMTLLSAREQTVRRVQVLDHVHVDRVADAPIGAYWKG